MAEILSAVDWGPMTILALVLAGFGIWFRDREKMAERRRNRQDERMERLLDDTIKERKENGEALKILVKANTEASQLMGRSFDGLCQEIRQHEQHSATRHNEAVRVMAQGG